MKKVYLTAIFSTIILIETYCQGIDTIMVFSNGKVGEIELRGTIKNIHYKLINSASWEDYFTKTYEIIPGCDVEIFYQDSSYIIGIETSCEKISLESRLRVGSRVYEINKLDSTYQLGIGQMFGFVKFNGECYCTIDLLLDDETMNKFWDSYNANPNKYKKMNDYLDLNTRVKKLRIFIVQKMIE